jgi:hypothetical protein
MLVLVVVFTLAFGWLLTYGLETGISLLRNGFVAAELKS